MATALPKKDLSPEEKRRVYKKRYFEAHPELAPKKKYKGKKPRVVASTNQPEGDGGIKVIALDMLKQEVRKLLRSQDIAPLVRGIVQEEIISMFREWSKDQGK